MKVLGTSLMVDFLECRNMPTELELKDLIKEAIQRMGAECLDVASHFFDNGGMSLCAIVSDSHIAIHTWPEHNFVSLDVYSCVGEPWKAVQFFEEILRPQNKHFMRLKRGIPLENEDDISTQKQVSGNPDS